MKKAFLISMYRYFDEKHRQKNEFLGYKDYIDKVINFLNFQKNISEIVLCSGNTRNDLYGDLSESKSAENYFSEELNKKLLGKLFLKEKIKTPFQNVIFEYEILQKNKIMFSEITIIRDKIRKNSNKILTRILTKYKIFTKKINIKSFKRFNIYPNSNVKKQNELLAKK